MTRPPAEADGLPEGEADRKTVLFVTHDVTEAVQLSDRIVVLAPGGRIHEIIDVDLPRPRKASDPAVAVLQAEVLARFETLEAMASAHYV